MRWMNAVLGDWQIAPLVRWQSGSPFSVTTGVDNALSGMGGQRAVQVLDDAYGDRTVNNYLNPAAFTSPAAGTYSALKPNVFVGPSRLQNDLAVSKTFKVGGADPAVPLGGVQRAEPRELQQPGLGVEQHELRPDPDGVGSANHAVRVQVRFLGRHPGWRRPLRRPAPFARPVATAGVHGAPRSAPSDQRSLAATRSHWLLSSPLR